MRNILFYFFLLLSFAVSAQSRFVYHSSGLKIRLENDGKRMFIIEDINRDTSLFRCLTSLYSSDNADRANVAQEQGFPTKGADNWFSTVLTSSFYNLGLDTVTYLYGNSSAPVSPYRVKLRSKASLNSCASTLCNYNGGGSVYLAGFQSGMNAYAAALAGNANADGTDMDGVETQNFASLQQDMNETLAEMRQSLSETYYEAVRDSNGNPYYHKIVKK